MKQIASKIRLMILLLLALQGALQAELLKVRTIEWAAIEENKKKINQLLFSHRVARVSLLTFSSIATLVEFYRCFEFFHDRFSQKPIPECSCLEKPINNQASQSSQKSSFLGRWLTSLKNLPGSKEFWQALLFGSSGIAMGQLMDIVNHPHTMAWFVNKKIFCRNTFDNIHIYNTLLQHTTLAEGKRIHYKQKLVNSCNRLVKQIEQICGFIQYKVEQLPNNNKQQINKIIHYLLQSTDKWIVTINKLLDEGFFEAQQFFIVTADYKKEVNRELDDFSCIEEDFEKIIL